MNSKLKRGKLAIGDAFAVPLAEPFFGHVQAVKIDRFGVLFTVFRGSSPDSSWESLKERAPSVLSYAYINSESAKKEWSFLGNFAPLVTGDTIPFFYGSSTAGWTVQDTSGNEKFFRAGVRSYDEMIGSGFLHKVLWLGPSIVEHIELETPLRWKGPL